MVGIVVTFLCWVDGGHWTERAFSFVVVNPDFDLVRGEGRDAFILEYISGGILGSDSSLHPALWPKWAESHHITKAWTTLQLLRNRLRRYEIWDDSEGWSKTTDLKDINTWKKCSYAQIRALRGILLIVVLYLQALHELSGLVLLHYVEKRQNYQSVARYHRQCRN